MPSTSTEDDRVESVTEADNDEECANEIQINQINLRIQEVR